MLRFTLYLLVVGVLFVSAQPSLNREIQARYSKSLNGFGLRLMNQLGNGTNLLFSPASISLALGMTAAGAAGNTLHEMQEVMGGAPPSYFQNLLTHLHREEEKSELDVANRLFSQKDYPFLPEFLRTTQEYFHAQAKNVDFIGNPDTHKMINAWVANKTHDKIKDLLPKPLDPLTRLVLVNAIYFKGAWRDAFSKYGTRNADFHLSNGQTTQVPMMRLREHLEHTTLDHLNTDVIKLPFKDSDISMVLLVPREGASVQKLQNELTVDDLDFVKQNLEWKGVRLNMPKFKMEYSASLIPALKSLGIKDLFADANLSKMDGTRGLYVKEVAHKAFIAVDENGCEAAAATAVITGFRSSGLWNALTININRPFMFLIRDEQSDMVLFAGRVENPKSEE